MRITNRSRFLSYWDNPDNLKGFKIVFKSNQIDPILSDDEFNSCIETKFSIKIPKRGLNVKIEMVPTSTEFRLVRGYILFIPGVGYLATIFPNYHYIFGPGLSGVNRICDDISPHLNDINFNGVTILNGKLYDLEKPKQLAAYMLEKLTQ